MKVYEYIIDPENFQDGMDFNSLVAQPAHMKPFLKFSKQGEKRNYSIVEEEERRVLGVLISANTLIYRREGKNEYYGVFKKDTITQIKEKLMREQKHQNLNTEHNSSSIVGVKGAYMTDIFQIDEKKGIKVPESMKDQNLEDGTLIAMYKIEDEELWQDIKEGKFTGFSIEAWLDVKPANIKKASMSKNKKSLVERIFGKQIVFSSATTADGVVVMWEGDLMEGTAVMVEVDGQQMPAPEGPHQITAEDGSVWAIVLDAEGKVLSMEQVEEMEGEEVMEQVAEVMSKMKDEYSSLITSQKEAFESEIATLKAEIEALKNEGSQGAKKTQHSSIPKWRTIK